MNPIALWLLSQAGAKLFNTAIDALAEITGIKEKPFPESKARNLLEDYSQRLEDASRRVIDRLDQDRLAILKSAIDQLKRAPKTVFKRETLADALSKFSFVAHLAEQGQTGGFPNAQLRSIARLGIAAVHLELQDPKDVIAENIGAAVYADSATAEQWLGRDIVSELLVAAVQSLANKRLVKKAPSNWGAFSFELRFSQDGASYTERHIDSNGHPYPGIASVVSNGIRLQSPNSPYYTVISGNKGVEYLNDSPTGVVYELLWK